MGKIIRIIIIVVGAALIVAAGIIAIVFAVNTSQSNDKIQTVDQKLSSALTEKKSNTSSKTKDKDKTSSDTSDDTEEYTSIEIDGIYYMGMLDMPTIGIEVPVAAQYSEQALQISPCVDSGTFDTHLIICGHNYSYHFGGLSSLNIGDPITITDADGNEHKYTVQSTETIAGSDYDTMHSGDWDLTLYTCDLSGNNRYTVRCLKS